MQALGLDYEILAARNPRIITCSISGFGSTGPLRDFPGFDQIAQGMSGLMSVTGTVESVQSSATGTTVTVEGVPNITLASLTNVE